MDRKFNVDMFIFCFNESAVNTKYVNISCKHQHAALIFMYCNIHILITSLCMTNPITLRGGGKQQRIVIYIYCLHH